MPGERMMSYVGGVVGNLVPASKQVVREDVQKAKSGSLVGFLTKTALFGGIVATSFYLGRDSTKPNSVVNKILRKPRKNKAEVEECVLHSYDHCTESIQVELALAFLGVPYKRKVYRFSDTDSLKPLGKKKLPVLELMGTKTKDALIIIDMLDENTTHRSIPPQTKRKDLARWLKNTRSTRGDLSYPRLMNMPVKDWSDAVDVRDAKRKWERKGLYRRDASSRTDELITKVNEMLEYFSDKILYDTYGVNEFGFGMDDIITLPHLRSLTCVKGIKWPRKVRSYLQNAFDGTIADLYFKHAV